VQWDQRGTPFTRKFDDCNQDPDDPTNPPVDIGAVERRSGDMDWDGDVDFDDVDDFVLGLNNPAGYIAMYGVAPSINGDFDCDNDLDFDDIPGFAACLGGSSAMSGGAASEAAFQELYRNGTFDRVHLERMIIETLESAASLDPKTEEAKIAELLGLLVDLTVALHDFV
jgi:hypothetical protein